MCYKLVLILCLYNTIAQKRHDITFTAEKYYICRKSINSTKLNKTHFYAPLQSKWLRQQHQSKTPFSLPAFSGHILSSSKTSGIDTRKKLFQEIWKHKYHNWYNILIIAHSVHKPTICTHKWQGCDAFHPYIRPSSGSVDVVKVRPKNFKYFSVKTLK